MEVPKLNALHSKYQKQGLFVLGVCASAGQKKMNPFAEENGIEYPIAADIKNQTINNYKVDGYHDYYLIDRFGYLRVADCKNDKLEEALIALLSEKE